jgi:ribosomal protein L29
MATKALKTLKNLSLDELKAKARELEGSLFDLRLKKATGQLPGSAAIWKARKELARVKTLATGKGAKV